MSEPETDRSTRGRSRIGRWPRKDRELPRPPRPSPKRHALSPPRTPPADHEVPFPLTFFLSKGERRDVLAALRCVHRNRVVALCRALGVNREEEEREDE